MEIGDFSKFIKQEFKPSLNILEITEKSKKNKTTSNMGIFNPNEDKNIPAANKLENSIILSKLDLHSLLKSNILKEEKPESLPNSNLSYHNGHWSDLEHQKFIEAFLLYGNNWKNVQGHIKTRSIAQARSHSQKYFKRLKRDYIKTKTLDKSMKNNKKEQDNVLAWIRKFTESDILPNTTHLNLSLEEITQKKEKLHENILAYMMIDIKTKKSKSKKEKSNCCCVYAKKKCDCDEGCCEKNTDGDSNIDESVDIHSDTNNNNRIETQTQVQVAQDSSSISLESVLNHPLLNIKINKKKCGNSNTNSNTTTPKPFFEDMKSNNNLSLSSKVFDIENSMFDSQSNHSLLLTNKRKRSMNQLDYNINYTPTSSSIPTEKNEDELDSFLDPFKINFDTEKIILSNKEDAEEENFFDKNFKI